MTHLRAADLAAATHDIDVVPVAETVIHLDAAHRGLGTASCGPDTLPEYRLDAGTLPLGLDAARPPTELTDADRMVGGRPRVPPPQRPDQLRRRGSTRTARSGICYFGPALAADRTFGHVETGRVRGLRQPRRRPGRRSNTRRRAPATTGSPALTVEQADGSGVLELVYVEHRVRAGKPAVRRRTACR